MTDRLYNISLAILVLCFAYQVTNMVLMFVGLLPSRGILVEVWIGVAISIWLFVLSFALDLLGEFRRKNRR